MKYILLYLAGMPRLILLVISFLLSFSSFSQELPAPDSIQRAIRVADTVKDNKIKWQFAVRALKWGKENDHATVMANACRIIAEIYRPERTAKLFEMDSLVIKYAIASGNKDLYFDACRILAIDFLNETKSVLAEKLINKMDSVMGGGGTAYQHCVINQLWGTLYFKRFNPPKSIEYFKISIPYAEESKNNILKLRALCQIGTGFTYRRKTDSASQYLFDALSLAKKIKDDFETGSVYDMLGFLFKMEGNAPRAMEYYQQAIPYYNSSGNPIPGAYTTLAIGETFIGQQQAAMAFPWLQKALRTFEGLHYATGLSLTYALLSRYYSGINQKDSSDYYASKIQTLKSASNPYINFYTEGHEAIRNVEQGNYAASDSILQRILPGAKNIISQELIQSAVDKANADEFTKEVKEETKKEFLTGDFKKLKGDTIMVNPFTGFPNKYDSVISDLVAKNENLVRTGEKQKQKELADSITIGQQALSLTQKELKIKNFTSRLAIVLLVAVSIIAILVYAGRKRILYEKNDAIHRIKGNLQVIDTNISDIKDQSKNPADLDLLKQKIFPLKALYRLLNDRQIRKVYMQDYLGDICNNLSLTYSLGRTIECKVEAPVYIPGKKAGSLGLIVNELVTNSFKHAFPEQSGGEIKVHCTRHRREYCLSVSDNGRGLPGELSANGSGLKLINGLAHELRARIVQKEKEGVNFEFYFF